MIKLGDKYFIKRDLLSVNDWFTNCDMTNLKDIKNNCSNR